MRFAAKEAVSKAFGTGIGAQLGWQDIEIRRKESGEPFVVLHGKGGNCLRRAAQAIHISLTHTENYAAATAILEGSTGERRDAVGTRETRALQNPQPCGHGPMLLVLRFSPGICKTRTKLKPAATRPRLVALDY